ncbi:ABC transporter ATP-binding protein [Paraburkholderia gardini]|uniref:ABC transporter ATP-binding protein n=1 Tax=Paraburkholderia gardini TaxID=2823469 RepID=UPI001D5E54AC|nr:ATP-binding cassette domain-containing protein [Paraburkholderia gardini]CAG4894435.1 Linearmycin resistance ATP-binding protein LnrL [Paraburkholderia gardini]
MLRFENLCKRYDERILFQGLHFSAGSGCIALDDESGSGKSTLLGILAGTIQADRGEVWIGGHSMRDSPVEARSAIACIPEDCMTYPDQTGHAWLEGIASTRKTALTVHALELAGRFGLTTHLDKRFEQMSFGTRKKMFLTAAALGDVKVVIADEPVGGLDAAARAVLIDLFKTLSQSRTVFFSSYDVDFSRACEARTISFAALGKNA